MATTRRQDEQILELESLVGSKYEFLRRLGGGGMAQVVLARHRGHGGLLAIKILSEHLAQDPLVVARFHQEAATAASLSGHPNIVPIYDIGEGGGLHYLVMPFIPGEDMGRYLRREGRLTAPDAAGVIAQAAEGLVWAESRGVVHRDLKPSNLQLDVAGRIYILDFGISKTVNLAGDLTRPDERIGTPYYMSPEHIRGEACDTRSDLYSLGVIFFELLSARRPFPNESVSAVEIAHLTAPPPSLVELVPDLPPRCDEIVQRLLSKDRAERYQEPQELLGDLYRHGATSGPARLRPLMDPELQAAISQPVLERPVPEGPPTDRPQAAVAAPEAGLPAAAAARLEAAGVPAGAGGLPRAQTAPLPARRPGVPGTALGLLMALMLALGAAAGVHLLRPGTPSGTVTPPKTAPLPRSIEDDHGVMLLVPAGAFIFGENAAESANPRRMINLPAFYIDRTEVSNAEYLRFIDATGRSFPLAPYARDHLGQPVTGVSHQDAAAYAAWAQRRLPTDQEWEKAARGVDGRPYPWGSQAWTRDLPRELQPVQSFPERRSPYGALNMAGNAWEWTATVYRPDERELTDMRSVLRSDSFSRAWYALKGGSFSPNGSLFFRLYLVRGFPEDQVSRLVGFRCARSAPLP